MIFLSWTNACTVQSDKGNILHKSNAIILHIFECILLKCSFHNKRIELIWSSIMISQSGCMMISKAPKNRSQFFDMKKKKWFYFYLFSKSVSVSDECYVYERKRALSFIPTFVRFNTVADTSPEQISARILQNAWLEMEVIK